MKRIIVFDLLYLKEFKQETFRSDFDELQFALSILFDITRIISEKDPALSGLNNDTLKMTRAFASLKNRVGIMVPFTRSIEAFRQLCEEPLKRKMSIDCEDEIFIGTPDMFRGVEKDIIIVTHLRNSIVDGLAQFDQEEYVRLAFSRAKHFLWVIGATLTVRGSATSGATMWNTFIKTA
jgi:AAA domain